MPDTLPGPSLESQIIFRLASMEANLTSGFKHIHEKIDNMQRETNNRHLDMAKELATVKAKAESVEEKFDSRIQNLEFFKTKLLAQTAALAFGVGFLWMLFGDSIKQLLGVN